MAPTFRTRSTLSCLVVASLVSFLPSSSLCTAQPPYISTFKSELSNDSACILTIGVQKTTGPVTCNACTSKTGANNTYQVIACDEDSKATDFSFGCNLINGTCGQCTSPNQPVTDNNCFKVEKDEGEEGPWQWTRIETGTEVNDCDQGLTDSLMLASYQHSEAPDPNISNVCRMSQSNGTVRTVAMIIGVTNECTFSNSTEYARLNQTELSRSTEFNGAFGCESANCSENCSIDVVNWLDGTCEKVGDVYYVISKCPSPSPSNNNGAVPDELIAVAVLVLVIGLFFIISACHKATKNKTKSGSLNSDNDTTPLVVEDALSRDYTGRVSFNNRGSSIVEAERRLASKAAGGSATKQNPIVEAEKIMAAVYAEKKETTAQDGFQPVTPVKKMQL